MHSPSVGPEAMQYEIVYCSGMAGWREGWDVRPVICIRGWGIQKPWHLLILPSVGKLTMVVVQVWEPRFPVECGFRDRQFSHLGCRLGVVEVHSHGLR